MVTLEAAPVEELSLRAQPLHDINATAAEVTHITAAHIHRKLLLRTLQVRSQRSTVNNRHTWVSSSYLFKILLFYILFLYK